MLKKSLSIILVISLVLGIVGCNNQENSSSSETNASQKDSLIIGLYGVKGNFDPNIQGDISTSYILKNIHDSLVDYNSEDGIMPSLAESWTISDDGMEYTFKIKENIKFHNGEILNCEDIIFTLEKAKNSPFLSRYVEAIKKCEEIGKNELKITLLEPKAEFLKIISSVNILNKKAYEEANGSYGIGNAVGTGCFKLKECKTEQYVIVERFDDYHGEPAKLREITFKGIIDPTTSVAALESGDLDMTINVSPISISRLKEDGKFSVIDQASSFGCMFAFNLAKEPFNDVNVRKAVAYAIDKNEAMFAEVEDYGTPAEYYLTCNGFLGFREDDKIKNYEYDIEKAKDFISKTKYGNGEEINILTMTGFGSAASEAIQDNIIELGLSAEIDATEPAAFMEKLQNKDFGITYWESENKTLDITYYYDMFHSKGSTNKFNYKNDELDKILDKGVVEVDDKKREEYIYQAINIIKDDCVAVPFYYVNNLCAYNKNLKNVKLYTNTQILNCSKVSWDN